MTTVGEVTARKLRIKAIKAEINLEDLKPCYYRYDFSKKCSIELDMYENGFTVEILKDVVVDEEEVKKKQERKKERKKADIKLEAIEQGIDIDKLMKWISVEDLKNINLDDEMEKREKEDYNPFNVFTLMKWIEDNRHLLPPKKEEKKKKIHPYYRHKDAIDSHLKEGEEEEIKKKPGDDEKALEELILRHGLQNKLGGDPLRYKKIIDYHWKYIKGRDEVTFFDGGVFESPPPLAIDDDAVPEFLQEKTYGYNKKQKLMEDDDIVDDEEM